MKTKWVETSFYLPKPSQKYGSNKNSWFYLPCLIQKRFVFTLLSRKLALKNICFQEVERSRTKSEICKKCDFRWELPSRCILLFVNSSYSWPSKQKMPLVGTLIIYFWQKCFSWYWPTLSLNMKYLLWLIDHKNEKFQVPARQERDSHCSASHIFWCCQLFQYLHLLCDWRQPVKMDCPWRTVCFLCASPV